jgi:hypothetical protein
MIFFQLLLINIIKLGCKNMHYIRDINIETCPDIRKYKRLLPVIKSSCTQTFLYYICNEKDKKPCIRRSKTVNSGLDKL